MIKRPPWILPVIIFSQFTGTSLWFASNAILADLRQLWNLTQEALGYMTSSVQLGFIAGTLIFAIFTISDRFSARLIFLICSILGALANLLIYLIAEGLMMLLLLRFITGFLLAGIYPVGMKIAAGWYEKGLGKALGFLVGALVVGTAFPHLLKSLGRAFPWDMVLIAISAIASIGGILMYLLVPDGPYLAKGSRFNSRALQIIFQSPDFRSAAFGYFGHMWELYAFWAFVPVYLSAYNAIHPNPTLNVSFCSFLIIGAGSLGCVAGGLISLKAGSAMVAFVQLLLSGICCLLSPLAFHAAPEFFFLLLGIWGITVVGDSPQYSALSARTAPRELVGSALTIVTSIGFAITIITIQFTTYISNLLHPGLIFLPLVPGPLFGLFALRPLFKSLSD